MSSENGFTLIPNPGSYFASDTSKNSDGQRLPSHCRNFMTWPAGVRRLPCFSPPRTKTEITPLYSKTCWKACASHPPGPGPLQPPAACGARHDARAEAVFAIELLVELSCRANSG